MRVHFIRLTKSDRWFAALCLFCLFWFGFAVGLALNFRDSDASVHTILKSLNESAK